MTPPGNNMVGPVDNVKLSQCLREALEASAPARELKLSPRVIVGPAIQAAACTALLVSYLLHNCQSRVGTLLDCILLALVCLVNWALYSSEAEFEFAEKRLKMSALISGVEAILPLSAQVLRAARVPESELPTMAYVLRAGCVWVPVPYNLLVEGDLIALRDGVPAPARIRSVPLSEVDNIAGEVLTGATTHTGGLGVNEDDAGTPSNDELIFERDDDVAVPPAAKWALDDARVAALHLCGNVGTFLVLETPVLSNVRKFLNKKQLLRNPQDTALARTVTVADGISRTLCIVCPLVALALAMLRLFVRPDGYGATVLVLEVPLAVWATLNPLALPLLREMLEIVAVAQLLDEIDQRQNVTNMTLSSSVDREDREEEQQSRAYRVSLWGFVRQFLRTFQRRLLFRYSSSRNQRCGGCRRRRRGRGLANEQQLAAADDVEKGFSAASGSAIGPTATPSCTLTQATAAIDALSDPLLCALPLVTLGSLTSLCCVDDKIILSPVPCAQEVYLLKGEHSSIVMDVSHDPAARFGVRFEDPKWTKQLGSLKPIGLTSTLACVLPIRQLSSLDQTAPTPANEHHPGRQMTRGGEANTSGVVGTEAAREASADRLLMGEGEGEQQQQQQPSQSRASPVLDALASSVVTRGTPDHLRNLASEIGFSTQDVSQYALCQVVLLYDSVEVSRSVPGMFYGHHHGRAQAVVLVVEDTSARRSDQPVVRRRRRGRGVPGGSSAAHDDRSLHMFTLGHPGIIIPRAAEYWDGESIWPLHPDDRNAILGLNQQWSKEDFDAVAFTYTPIPTALNVLFPQGQLLLESDALGTPAAGAVDDRAADSEDSAAAHRRLSSDRCIQMVVARPPEPQHPHQPVRGGAVGRSSGETAGPSSVTKTVNNVAGLAVAATGDKPKQKQQQQKQQVQGDQTSLHKRAMNAIESIPSKAEGSSRSTTTTTSAAGPDEDPLLSHDQPSGDQAMDLATKLGRIGDLLERQIFVGMVGSQEQPNSSMTLLIEDLRAAGIRFVHFSTREPRRARVVADKMGLETDWNTSISLKELSSEAPQDTRFEWDVKARLPHGIEEIKRHLAEVDEVPLLVSTFTNSSPTSSRAMMQIMQDNHEILAAVGNGLNMANFDSFLNADVGISMLPHVLTTTAAPVSHSNTDTAVSSPTATTESHHHQEEEVPHSPASASGVNFSEHSAAAGGGEQDAASAGFHNMLVLSSAFNSLPCAIVLRETTDPYILVDLLREARRLHTNLRQGFLLIYGAKATLAMLLCASLVLSVPIVLTTGDVVWLLFVQVPLLVCAMLFNAGEKQIMTRMPPKRQPAPSARELMFSRAGAQLFVLAAVSAAELLVVHVWTYTALVSDTAGLAPRIWWQTVSSADSQLLDLGYCANSDAAASAMVARACVLVACALNAIMGSVALMNRTESVYSQRLWSPAWWITVVVVLGLQVLYNEVATRLSGHASLIGSGLVWASQIPLAVWMVVLLWPIVFLVLTEGFKVKDRRIFNRDMQRLRLIFDTRLGMYSPK